LSRGNSRRATALKSDNPREDIMTERLYAEERALLAEKQSRATMRLVPWCGWP
jgi:hypothetical protein